jgi:hypothetical protein
MKVSELTGAWRSASISLRMYICMGACLFMTMGRSGLSINPLRGGPIMSGKGLVATDGVEPWCGFMEDGET